MIYAHILDGGSRDSMTKSETVKVKDYYHEGVKAHYLFCSVPMRGRTDEEIHKSMEKMRRIAEALFGVPMIVIDQTIQDKSPDEDCQCRPVWYLGESLKCLARAEYFIGSDTPWNYPGCLIEWETARDYFPPEKVAKIEPRFFMDDYVELDCEAYTLA